MVISYLEAFFVHRLTGGLAYKKHTSLILVKSSPSHLSRLGWILNLLSRILELFSNSVGHLPLSFLIHAEVGSSLKTTLLIRIWAKCTTRLTTTFMTSAGFYKRVMNIDLFVMFEFFFYYLHILLFFTFLFKIPVS